MPPIPIIPRQRLQRRHKDALRLLDADRPAAPPLPHLKRNSLDEPDPLFLASTLLVGSDELGLGEHMALHGF